MNKSLSRALACALTLALLSGCAQQPATDSGDASATGTPAQLLENAAEQSDLLPLDADASGESAPLVLSANAVTALRAVLNGEAACYCMDYAQALDLPHLLARYAADFDPSTLAERLTTLEFTIFRSDDTLCAVVSLGAHDASPLAMLVLHCYADAVYAALIEQPGAFPAQLRTDGSFPWEDTAERGWQRLSFRAQRYAPTDYLREREDASGSSFLLDGLSIDQSLFSDLSARQSQQPLAPWYTLTRANLDTALPAEEDAPDPYDVVFTTIAEAAPVTGGAELSLYRDYLAQRTAAYTRTTNASGFSYIDDASLFTRPNLPRGTDDTDAPWRARYFTLLDLDGNGTLELLLAVTNGCSYEYDIYTCDDGTLYRSTLGERSFQSPRADGSFSFSSGADEGGFARAAFNAGELTLLTLAERSGERCTVGGTETSSAEYEAFRAQQSAKDALSWFVFTPEAVAAVLGEISADGTNTLRESRLGLLLTYPAAWERTGIVTADLDTTGTGGELTLFSLREKRACAYYNGDAGLVWTVCALSRDSFRYWLGDDFRIDEVIGPAKYVLGADEDYVYILSLPTDVEYIEGDTLSRSQYEALQSSSRQVLADFLAANGIEVNEVCPASPVYQP